MFDDPVHHPAACALLLLLVLLIPRRRTTCGDVPTATPEPPLTRKDDKTSLEVAQEMRFKNQLNKRNKKA